jgi:transcriptional regulator with XRE-family HTH domain
MRQSVQSGLGGGTEGMAGVETNPMLAVGRAVRRLRDKAGLTQTELAKLVLSSKSQISAIETGTSPAKRAFMELLDETLNADGLLVELWLLARSGSFSSATIADIERTVTKIHAWDLRVVPGLLQTPDYMRGFMRSGRATPEQIEKETAVRITRQEILFSPKLIAAWFVLDESILYRPYGGSEAMRDQLIRLEQAAEMPDVFVQVMPYSSTGHPGGEGPLRVMEYPDSPAIWYTEGWHSGRMTDAPDEVASAMTNFDIIRASALPPDESASFIASIRSSRYE